MMFRLLALLHPVMAFFAAKSISQKFSLTARQNQVLFLIGSVVNCCRARRYGAPARSIHPRTLGGLGAFLIRFLPIDEASSFLAVLMSRRAASQPKRVAKLQLSAPNFLRWYSIMIR